MFTFYIENHEPLGSLTNVFAHKFPDISIKSNKLHFQSWRKISPTTLLFFRKMTAKVSRNNCAKWHWDWTFLSYFSDSSNLAGSVTSWYVGEVFSPALEMQFVRFYWNIKKFTCKYKPSLTKIETLYIVVLLNDTNCQFVDFKYWKCGHYTFILVKLEAIFVSDPKGSWFRYRK